MADTLYRWSPNDRLYSMTRSILGPLIERYFRAEWRGTEHIPLRGPVVLACNHLSNLDPVALGAACPRHINYLAKIELFRVPVLGLLIRSYGAIPLRRSASDPDAIRLAERVLEQGQLLALFPEGTRSRDGSLKPFRFGAARLALKYNAPLVPAAITGSDRAMPTGSRLPHRVTLRIAFGAPLAIDEYRYVETGVHPEAETLMAVTHKLQDAVLQLKQSIEE